jgi:addiction module RelE/StbE family toxin
MTIRAHKNFKKQFNKLTESQKEKFRDRRNIFLQDEFHPILNNHMLKGKYGGYRSINVGGDLRAIFKKNSDDIFFIAIGSHSKLYG